MLHNPNRIVLPSAEASCLEVLRSGASIKSQVAVRVGLDLKRTNAALRRLAEKGLAVAAPDSPRGRPRWQPTPRGETALISTEPDDVRRLNRRDAMPPNGSAQRLLRLLDRPRRGVDLAAELGVSQQRVHQNIVRLLALSLIRSADLARPTRIVARIDDPTPLLRLDEEKVLSAMPDEDATTIKKLARRLGFATERVRDAIAVLIAKGLVDTSGRIGSPCLFRTTPSGAAHAQFDPSAKRAEPPSLPVKSDRVRSVLNYLVESGPTRTTKVGQDLDIALPSVNALMQYLKRRGLVRKAGDAFGDPHEITPEGRYVWEEMIRHAGQPNG
jgi:Mn-dependent DtxR family transcriptional regulator